MGNNDNLVFGKMNYILMLSGIGVILLGYILISLESAPYGFGFLGLTLGPILLVLGFGVEFFAILYKSKNEKE